MNASDAARKNVRTKMKKAFLTPNSFLIACRVARHGVYSMANAHSDTAPAGDNTVSSPEGRSSVNAETMASLAKKPAKRAIATAPFSKPRKRKSGERALPIYKSRLSLGYPVR